MASAALAPLKVLISGTGIAGTTLTYWLLRAFPRASATSRPIHITLIERYPTLRLTGASVDIRGSGVDVMRRMGLEPEIRSRSTNEEGIQVVNPAGRPVATFKATGNDKAQSITSEFEIFRGELAKVFVDAVKKVEGWEERVDFVLGEEVKALTKRKEGGKVEVEFKNGREKEMFDLVVAADGLGSRIRGMMLEKKPRDQLMPENTFAAFFTIKRDLLGGSRLARWYNAPGGRSMLIRPDPARYTRANLICVTTGGEGNDKFHNALREGNEAYKKLLEELYGDAGWITPDVLEGMRESDDFYASEVAMVRADKLYDGGVVLLGDAGYAMQVYGTSNAMVGGYALAGELMQNPGDIETALKRYQEIVHPFISTMQDAVSPTAALWTNPQTQRRIDFRNTLLWLVNGSGLDRLVMSIATWFGGFADRKFPLPDYQWPESSK